MYIAVWGENKVKPLFSKRILIPENTMLQKVKLGSTVLETLI